MIAPRKIIADRFSHTVFQEHTCIIAEHCISYRRFNTHACRASGDDEVFDPESQEHVVQLGFAEPAESVLVYGSVLSSRLQVRNYVCVPSVSNEHSTFRAVRCGDFLPNTETQVPRPVWRVSGSQVREVCSEAPL